MRPATKSFPVKASTPSVRGCAPPESGRSPVVCGIGHVVDGEVVLADAEEAHHRTGRCQARRLHAVGEHLHDLVAQHRSHRSAVLTGDEHEAVRGLSRVVREGAGDDLLLRFAAAEGDADECVGATGSSRGPLGAASCRWRAIPGSGVRAVTVPVSASSSTSSLGSRAATSGPLSLRWTTPAPGRHVATVRHGCSPGFGRRWRTF